MATRATTRSTAVAPDLPPVEQTIALDMVRRGLPVAPIAVLVAWLVGGGAAAASVGLAITIVLVNLVLSALILGRAAKISLNAIMVAALLGFAVRMALVVGVVYLVQDASWIHLPTLAVAIVVTHLGLLFWETRFVSASLAYPDLAPTANERSS